MGNLDSQVRKTIGRSGGTRSSECCTSGSWEARSRPLDGQGFFRGTFSRMHPRSYPERDALPAGRRAKVNHSTAIDGVLFQRRVLPLWTRHP